ncbi:transcription initiation factor IIA, gamma subunit, helical domain-containing protein [Syncephalis pseudoplumigaleata]|uniref:Transcription initiation factor IIA subunit 2 n=1 Tax=Syncephalis pseudoplumigaleata TaxID=1712513 RepID=A0A4P9YS50_9FUNG|nr:transcription initiation factor IIA, gamma subunit, helical domain-containing protein [Syncephalis pseudoplumigaleata]|eukprot:RKP22743.1 transcription initiation factor IIA, gamma subunit, helical domain-containing protein [Syncephalis pseudoplumigaleata]
MATQYYEHYRQSTLGNTLTEALDELIEAGHLTPQLAMRVLTQFDKSMADALSNSVRSRVAFKGHLHTYNFCDDVWTFTVEHPVFRFDHETVTTKKIKIVACNGRKPGEA